MAPDSPDYKAVGYECSPSDSTDRVALIVQPAVQGPYCRTVFFFNTVTKTLAAFATTSAQYATERGTTVGMTRTEAEQREGLAATDGCVSGITLGYVPGDPASDPNAAAKLVIDDDGSTVTDLRVESRANGVGSLFC